MKSKIAVIIPCYKASNKVGIFVNNLLGLASNLKEIYEINFFVVDDCCPESSYKEVSKSNSIYLIHNKINLGVGGSSIAGFRKALEMDHEIFIKMDADGQHPAEYLRELIPYVLDLPKNELTLVKGTRYLLNVKDKSSPIIRRSGSFLLEPLARISLMYKGLTDISNGFISFNKITLNYLLSKKIKGKLEPRYLFESSILKKCSNIRANIHQFQMHSLYGEKWVTSMKSHEMIFPLLTFWTSSLTSKIFNKYILQLNLGSLFLISSMISFFITCYYLFVQLLPKINSNILVSAGNATFFTANLIISILFFCLFILYDYSKKKFVKNIFFNEFLK